MKKFTASSEIGPGCLISFGRFFAIVFLVVLLGSCKATKFTQKIDSAINDSTAVSKTETTTNDSTALAINSQKDVSQSNNTTNNTISDSQSLKDKENNTVITFGPAGGTYNQNTGDFTNVASINITTRERELQTQLNSAQQTIHSQTKAIENQQLTITRVTELYEHSLDSINKLNSKFKSTTIQKETPKSDWYWWLIIGVILGVVAIPLLQFVLARLPITSWIFKFINLFKK